MSVWDILEQHLPSVQTPVQYIGAEWNSIRKDRSGVPLTVALAVPESYRGGMSAPDLHILYGLLNQREDTACERVFLPQPDMTERLRQHGIPLCTLEDHAPLSGVNMIIFCHLTVFRYPNLLTMLDLAGIPLRSAERTDRHPLIVGTGPAMLHPEPVGDFLDGAIVGDVEEAVPALIDRYKECAAGGGSDRNRLLKRLAQTVPGMYVPGLYTVDTHPDGTRRSVTAAAEIPPRIKKTWVRSLDEAYYPESPVVPYTEVVHDRIQLEVNRGTQLRSVETLLRQAEAAYRNTGYNEIALVSSSLSDYPHLVELVTRLQARFKTRKVDITAPSLRIRRSSVDLPAWIKLTQQSSITVDLGCGSEPRRRLFGYPATDDEALGIARAVFREGGRSIKLRFAVGWPGEQDADIQAMVDLSKRVSACGREAGGREKDVTLVISSFVPEPHTPFQWFPAASLECLLEIEQGLNRRVKKSRIHLRFSDPKRDRLEAVLARGDRRMGEVFMHLYRTARPGEPGGRGGERFSIENWNQAFLNAGIDPQFYCSRTVPVTELLPWDVIETDVPRADLAHRYEAMAEGVSAAAAVEPEKEKV